MSHWHQLNPKVFLYNTAFSSLIYYTAGLSLKTIFYQDNSVRWIDIQNKSARIYWMDSLLCHGLKFILLQHLIHSSGWSSYTEIQFGDKYFRLKYSPFNCIHI